MTPTTGGKNTEPGASVDIVHKLSGHFTLRAQKVGGSGGRILADFHNTILDQGLDWIFTNISAIASPWRFAQVGASSAPEDPSQTTLGSRVAWAQAAGNTNQQLRFDTLTLVTSPRFEIRCVKTIRFAAGAAAGNIAEVAIGWGSGLNDIFCRALVRDENGDPTTVQVAADEFLDVTYTLTIAVDVTDKVFTLNLPGGTHEGLLRPALLNASELAVANFLKHGLRLEAVIGGASGRVTNGSVGPITGGPTGAITGVSNASDPQPYTAGSAYRDVLYSLGLSQGNIAGGVSAWLINFVHWHDYQAQFTPPIPKTPDKIFTVRLRISLARA